MSQPLLCLVVAGKEGKINDPLFLKPLKEFQMIESGLQKFKIRTKLQAHAWFGRGLVFPGL